VEKTWGSLEKWSGMGLERWSIRTAAPLLKTKKFHHIMSFWNALAWRARIREDVQGWCSASLHIGCKRRGKALPAAVLGPPGWRLATPSGNDA